jgi:hypothetical protein
MQPNMEDMMKIYRIEWFADEYPRPGKYCHEYYKNPINAAQRIVQLQEIGYDPSIETIYVME